MIYVVTWLWGNKWSVDYVKKLFASLERNLTLDYFAVLATSRNRVDEIDCGADIIVPIDQEDRQYLSKLGCLARMRMFDKVWQQNIGAIKGDKIVNIDVDAVITGNVDKLFRRDDEFSIMQHYNTTNPCPFNGSLWMFRAGERHDVWEDFGPEAHARFNVPIHAIADDQGWLHFKFPNARAYTIQDGVYAYHKKTWPVVNGLVDNQLPRDARIVAFPGRDPARFQHFDWVKEHWRC